MENTKLKSEQNFLEQQRNEGLKVASVYLPKRVINPEECQTDVNDFFESLDGIIISEIKHKSY